MAAPGAQPPVLTSDQLRTVGVSYCPVPGCRKKPEGFKSSSALRFHMQSHAPGSGAGDAVLDELPPAAPVPEMIPAPGPRGAAAGAGPYHCPEPNCPFGPGKKTLKSVKTAMQHAKKHAAPGTEEYACERPGCNRKFALRYRLTEHSKTCGKKPFHCKCGLALGHKSSLKTHIAQWNKTAPGEHADVTPLDAGGAAAGGDQLVGGAAGDADADAAAAAELDAAVMAAAGVDADANGLNM